MFPSLIRDYFINLTNGFMLSLQMWNVSVPYQGLFYKFKFNLYKKIMYVLVSVPYQGLFYKLNTTNIKGKEYAVSVPYQGLFYKFKK